MLLLDFCLSRPRENQHSAYRRLSSGDATEVSSGESCAMAICNPYLLSCCFSPEGGSGVEGRVGNRFKIFARLGTLLGALLTAGAFGAYAYPGEMEKDSNHIISAYFLEKNAKYFYEGMMVGGFFTLQCLSSLYSESVREKGVPRNGLALLSWGAFIYLSELRGEKQNDEEKEGVLILEVFSLIPLLLICGATLLKACDRGCCEWACKSASDEDEERQERRRGM